jgi:protein ImuB
MAPRILCAALPNWPIQRFRSSLPPEQKSSPLVLIRRDVRRGRLIVGACDAAQRAGVRPGLAASVVDSIVRDDQSWIISEHDPWDDLKSLEALAARCVGELCPVVALEPLAPAPWADQWLHQPQALLMDLAGIDHLYGGESGLLQHFTATFREWGWTATLALAGSVGLAWGVAHYGLSPGDSLRVSVEEESEVLTSLPLAALRLPEKIVETLHRLGIDVVGDLLPIPRPELIRRFDSVLLERVDQATGSLAEPLVAYQELPPPNAAANFDYPTKNFELLDRCVESLIAEIAKNLKLRGQGALRLECHLRLEGKPAQQFDVSFFAPSAEARHLGELLGEALHRRSLPAPVASVRITASLLGPLAEVAAVSGSSLARLVDQLSNRLGREKVLGVSLEADQQPELGYRLIPLAGQKQRITAAAKGGKSGKSVRNVPKKPLDRDRLPGLFPSPQDPLRRPLSLLNPPQPLEMEANLDERTLHRFRWQSQWYSVSRHWGPERIETGWWRGPSVRREYYRVESSDGGWWWIFQRIGDRRWFLHGRFD